VAGEAGRSVLPTVWGGGAEGAGGAGCVGREPRT